MDKFTAIERQNKKLSILYEIALTVGKSLDLKAIIDDVLGIVLAFMGVDAGVIYVIDEATREMIPVAFRNLTDAVVKDLSENRVKVGECMCGNIAQCGREVVIREKAYLDPRFTRKVLEKEKLEFYAGLPLKARNKVVGVLCAITHAPYTPDEELLDILRAATQPIGLAIENAGREEALQRAHDELEARVKERTTELLIANEKLHQIALENARLYEETKELSLRDSLTGLWNHEEILRILGLELTRADREGSPVSVIMADLDHFKRVNDTYGHQAGDDVLREAANRMRSLFRSYDAVGRYGGGGICDRSAWMRWETRSGSRRTTPQDDWGHRHGYDGGDATGHHESWGRHQRQG
jgi:GGDEF domain-containing protein